MEDYLSPFMLNSSYPMLANAHGDHWSLDYEGRRWIKKEDPLKWQEVDRDRSPDRLLPKFKDDGQIIGLKYDDKVVMESTSMNGPWTPIEGVLLRYNLRMSSHLTLVPNSFAIHCTEN